jgi:nucleotide-binding universal stress UspA family protein
MFRHILVPLDGSERSERAIPHALSIASDQTKITLFHVIPILLVPFPASPEAPVVAAESEYYEKQRVYTFQRVETYLKRVASTIKDWSGSLEFRFDVGNDPALVILDFCDRHAVDVIVMATRGQSGLSRWLMGSVTQKVLQAAHCPVFVIPTHEDAKPKTQASSASSSIEHG